MIVDARLEVVVESGFIRTVDVVVFVAFFNAQDPSQQHWPSNRHSPFM